MWPVSLIAPAMITMPGKVFAGDSAKGDGLSLPSLLAEITTTTPFETALLIALITEPPGDWSPPSDILMTLAPAETAMLIPCAIGPSQNRQPSESEQLPGSS